ncbi:MAG: peroxiredoxin [Bacteroidetes bacterium]|nr:peroxiredoxin [Bacteroidota bacterium]
MSIKIGDAAPEFSLVNSNVEKIKLSDYKGDKNVVLLFFPMVNSSVCEKELCSTRDGLSQYEDLNAQVLAISVDSHYAQKLWTEKHKFNFPLLSDFNKEVSQKYGVIHDIFAPGKLDYKGVSKRSVFVIDKNGIVRHAEILENPGNEPNYEAVKEILKKLD